MTRSKVTLAYITNDTVRKSSYKKRKRGLIKKVSELSILCDVPACAVIYNEYNHVPEVWPSTEGAVDTLTRFNRLCEMEKTRNMVTQEIFMRQQIKKAQEHFIRLHQENCRADMEHLMYRCVAGLNSLNLFDMKNNVSYMKSFLDQTRRDINSRIEELRKQNNQHL